LHNGELVPNDGSTNVVEHAAIRWTVTPDRAMDDTSATYQLPVYLYSDRKDLLFTVPLPCSTSSPGTLIQTGVALLAGE
jgi:hypothetical protein